MNQQQSLCNEPSDQNKRAQADRLVRASVIFIRLITAFVLAVLVTYLTPPQVANAVTGGSNLIQTTSDGHHSCAITAAGGLECWGDNLNGQLGTGDTTVRTGPTLVSGLSSGVTDVAVGSNFTCALATGQVKCWGINANGQLGDGTNTNRLTPVTVSGLVSGTVTAITAGSFHACALTNSGGVKCWGYNNNGQLGNGATTNSNVPLDVSGLTSGVAVVDAGNLTTCAVTNSGGAKCWGDNNYRQLGNGTTADSLTPVDVSGLTSNVQAISVGGQHTCALTSNAAAKCWGTNGSGQLGDGTITTRLTPVDVATLNSNVVSVEAGSAHTCALLAGGNVKCWGDGYLGKLGDGSVTDRTIPVDVVGLPSGVGDVTAGVHHSCAMTTNGAALCWGFNGQGQLGNGETLDSSKPVYVAGQAVLFSTAATAATADGRNVCMLTAQDGLKCWGAEGTGQLGEDNDATIGRAAPVDVSGLISGVAHAAIAHSVGQANGHGCAALTNGGVKCWGDNATGELGDGSTTNHFLPADVSGFGLGSIGVITKITGGGDSFCALTNNGGVRCWGNNASGQLGDGTMINRLAPAQVTSITSGATAVGVGTSHACAVVNSGVKCWGYNAQGQLGDGTAVNRTTPVSVVGLTSGVTALALGDLHSCALLSDGTMKCWGINTYGQLGDGTTTSRQTPVSVSGLSGVVAITTGDAFTCALTSSGGVKCWGNNSSGQLGNGTTTTSNIPVDVSGLTSGISAIEGGGSHACAITSSGGVKCWGYNAHGQFGNGSTTNSSVPVNSSGLSSGVTQLTAGQNYTCAIVNGAEKCSGNNLYGQLGNGSTTTSNVLVNVSGLTSGVTEIAASQVASCAIVDGMLKCWGYNLSGQLGDGSTLQRTTPVKVAYTVVDATFVAATFEHTCVITAQGGVKCWGRNNFGQLGDNTTTNRAGPVDVIDTVSGQPITNVVSLSLAYTFSCALFGDGGVKCWGNNSGYKLGNGTTTDSSTPTAVTGLTSGVSAIAVGDSGGCAALAAGGVKCWGQNTFGQLGDGTLTARSTPVSVSSLSSVATALAAGGSHACALLSTGAMQCWGYNADGQLGNGTTTNSLVPVNVTGLLNGATSIAAGGDHTCAILSIGEAYCWGYNDAGVLGVGTGLSGPVIRSASVPVSLLIGKTAAGATAPDLTLTIGQPAPALVVGVASNIPMTVSNIGTAPTTGPIMATMTLPANISAPASFSNNGWSCTTSGQTVTCTNPGPINNGISRTVQVPVTPHASTIGAQPGPFTGTVATPGESNTGNNNAAPMTPTTPVSAAPTSNLLIGKSGPVTATQGTNFSYTLVVTNTGIAATNGVITVTDTLPAGLSFVSGSGSGFTCAASGQNVTCTSSVAIAISGTATINLTVNPTTTGVKSNSASVIGGGDTSAATSNTVNTTVDSAPTATPTVTPTATETSTATPTATPTSTATNTSTATPTATTVAATATPTATPTNTTVPPTATATATATATSTSVLPTATPTVTPTSTTVVTGGIEYKIVYNAVLNRYEVWMRANVTPWAPNQTVTAQVTIKVPHVAGSGAFTVTNRLDYVDTQWPVGSIVRTPSEAVGYDYLSFDLDFPTGNTGALAWQAGVERLAFSFQNGGVCSGPVTLMANNDPFNIFPNSAGTNPGNAIDVLTLGNDPGNDFLGDYSSGAALCPVASSVTLPVKVFLQGPYLQAAGMMTDTLRSKGLVPTSSPYTATATTTAGVLAVTGNNAIVDWVLVEVRNSATPATVVARQSALLQRDGDVVAVDGTSTLTFTLSAGNYHVAVKHRNHLGAMTATPVALSAATPLVDFTASAGYGTSGQATVGSVYALWMGNTSGDNRVIGAGPTNDRNAILAEALSAPGNANHNANYIVTSYSNGDVNLDGRVIAAGPGNDINYILYNVFVHPGNGSAAANFVVQGQVP